LVRCQRLPRALKDWQEYQDLCEMIDGFNALMPLLGQMSHEAMTLRHWKHIEALTGQSLRHWTHIKALTGQSLDAETQQFTLGDVLRPDLLHDKHKLEVPAGNTLK